MLYEVMRHINNFFIQRDRVKTGTFTIENGTVNLPFVAKNQYYLITGSVFNDGVWKYDEEVELIDEIFTGTVSPMAVPKSFILLVGEIESWQMLYGTADKAGPYTSENIGTYSYSKATNSTGGMITWKDAYKERLNAYRKK